jgi:heat shock protein HslJ
MNESHPHSSISGFVCSVLVGASIASLSGCADKHKELEPRVDTRPMVDAIQQAEEDWIWISGQQWALATIEGQIPIPNTSLRLNFKEHTWLEGDAGCNRYTASYVRKADAGLQISEVLSTRMYCAQPAGVMQQESRYFHLLKQIDAYHAEPDRLDLLADGAVVLSFVVPDIQQSP